MDEEKDSALSPDFTTVHMNQVVRSAHVNKWNVLDGGQLLKWVDICACLSAERLAAFPCVTVSVDDLYFERETQLGDVISIKANVNRVFNTSMEVGVKAYCESLSNMTRDLVCKAFMTFVALDSDGKKVKLPTFECKTSSQQKRFALASERRKVRISHYKTVQQLLDDYKPSPILGRKSISSTTTNNDNNVFTTTSNFVNGSDTSVSSVELVLPPHANHHGNTFGGQIMAWMENNASISAGRYFRCCTTLKSVDMVHFKGPSTVGDRVVIRSTVNNVFNNSLEVGVRVEAYRYCAGKVGKTRHINSAFFTYDAADDDNDARCQFAVFVPVPGEGERRLKEATARRKLRFDRRYSLSRDDIIHSTYDDVGNVVINASNSTMLSCSNVISFSNLAALKDWKVVSSHGKTELATLEKNGILSFRVTLHLNDYHYNVEKVFQVVQNPLIRPKWDNMMVSCKEVSRISSDDAVYHLVVKSPDHHNGQQSNDFILLISSRTPETHLDSYKVAMCSVDLPSVPITTEYKRTNINCSGFVVHSKADNTCTKIVYYNKANAQIASYITHDMAGLSKKYHTTFTSLLSYLNQHISNE